MLSPVFVIIKPSDRVAFIIIDWMCVENESELEKIILEFLLLYQRSQSILQGNLFQ